MFWVIWGPAGCWISLRGVSRLVWRGEQRSKGGEDVTHAQTPARATFPFSPLSLWSPVNSTRLPWRSLTCFLVLMISIRYPSALKHALRTTNVCWFVMWESSSARQTHTLTHASCAFFEIIIYLSSADQRYAHQSFMQRDISWRCLCLIRALSWRQATK